MDKEKKIISCETCNHKNVCYDLLTNKDYNFKGYGCLRYCRDLYKDSIVISKEEYRKLKLKRKNAMAIETARKVCEHIENDNKKIRKETAREILTVIRRQYPPIDDDRATLDDCYMINIIEDLMCKYGVEIGEEE